MAAPCSYSPSCPLAGVYTGDTCLVCGSQYGPVPWSAGGAAQPGGDRDRASPTLTPRQLGHDSPWAVRGLLAPSSGVFCQGHAVLQTTPVSVPWSPGTAAHPKPPPACPTCCPTRGFLPQPFVPGTWVFHAELGLCLNTPCDGCTPAVPGGVFGGPALQSRDPPRHRLSIAPGQSKAWLNPARPRAGSRGDP